MGETMKEPADAKRRLRIPAPPKVGPFRDDAFTSPLHNEKVAAILGVALGVCFTVCFVTGLISHLIQNPPSWFTWPSRPAGYYRINQGLHVATGTAAIPLLLAKLWTVYPKLFAWPPFRNVAQALERLSLVPLIGGSLFLLTTGLLNTSQYRPWAFGFRPGHYWAAWITMGALVVHIGAKFATTRRVLLPAPATAEPVVVTPEERRAVIERRTFLATIAGAAGLVTAFTIGQTVGGLNRIALLSPRRVDVGPQGFPVNRTAASVGVLTTARDPAYTLVVAGKGVRTPLTLSLADLKAMPQHEATLPIACVEGWSVNRTWRGVRVRDLLEMAGAPANSSARVVSIQKSPRLKSAPLNHWQAHDPDSLLAMEVNGEPLDIEHGYPIRFIGPNRPGVQQTKWVGRLEVV